MPVSHKNGIAIASISHLNGVSKSLLSAIGGIALPAGSSGPTVIANAGGVFSEVGNGLSSADMVLSGSNIAIFGGIATVAFGGSPVPVSMDYENTVRTALTRQGTDVAYGFGGEGRFAAFTATGVPAGSRDIGGDWDETPIQAFMLAIGLSGVSGFSNWQQLASQAYGDTDLIQRAAPITLTGCTAGEKYYVFGGYNTGNTPNDVTAGTDTTIEVQRKDFLGGAFIMSGTAAGPTLTLTALLNQQAGADPENPGNFFTWGLRGARADA